MKAQWLRSYGDSSKPLPWILSIEYRGLSIRLWGERFPALCALPQISWKPTDARKIEL